MKTILVFGYFFKTKEINKIIKTLYDKSSKTNSIVFNIYDQNNEKNYNMPNNINITYSPIFWDDRKGIGYYRSISLNKQFDYFFEIGNIKDIEFDWDIKLIEISKNSFVSLENKVIDTSFMFYDKKISSFLTEVNQLKYYGQDWLIRYFLYKNNIDVVFLNNNFCQIENNKIESTDYCPYSLYHMYNEKMDIVKNDLGFIQYCNLNNIDIKKIKYRYNQHNDLNYFNLEYNLDFKESEKFHKVTKKLTRENNV